MQQGRVRVPGRAEQGTYYRAGQGIRQGRATGRVLGRALYWL